MERVILIHTYVHHKTDEYVTCFIGPFRTKNAAEIWAGRQLEGFYGTWCVVPLDKKERYEINEKEG